MKSAVDIYKKYQAQTFLYPSLLEVEKAEGSYIFDTNNKRYLDFIAGVSATSIGHSNQEVIEAVKSQKDKYTHVMVYGNMCKNLNINLQNYYLTIYQIHYQQHILQTQEPKQ